MSGNVVPHGNDLEHTKATPIWESALAVHGDRQSGADLLHAKVAQASESLDEHRNRDALDRVKIDCRSTRHGIAAGLEHDLARQPSDRRRARPNERPPKPRNGCISGQDDDRSLVDARELAPPHLATFGRRGHDAAAASRNEARSPHSSGSSRGWAS